MPTTCFCELPDAGYEAVIFTLLIVREDTHHLYGFSSKQLRVLFRELIKINGIGPKLALMILSKISTELLINVVEHKESTVLVKLPGIGKKTAERLIVEMKDRLKNVYKHSCNSAINLALTTSAAKLTNHAALEAITALVTLGYKPLLASLMVSKVTATSNYSSDSSETIIREALRAAL